jgi:hypothetical protein
VAVTVAVTWLATEEVVAVKVLEVSPACTVTLGGTCTAELLLDRLTAAPALGAAPLRVTVPVEEAPPVTVAGLKLSALTVGRADGFTVRLKLAVLAETPLPLAVMLMVWLVTREALLAACRVIVPVFPVPGWVMFGVTPLGRVLVDRLTPPV